LEHPTWEEEINPIWLATSITLFRNLATTKFPSKQNDRELLNTCQLLKEALPNKIFLPAEKLSPHDKELIFEHFLSLKGFQDTGLGQAFALDTSGRFLARINQQDHLHLQLIDTTDDIDSLWGKLLELELEISQKHPFAFSPKFGFLTSDPVQCGTALQACLYLHLPALHHTGQLHQFCKNEDEISFIGLEGSINDLIGDLLILKNRYTLGVNEEVTLHSLQTIAIRLIHEEKKLREQLKETGNSEIKDLVSRAYGLLLHSYQLQTKETLNALSALKLGLSLGWIKGISSQKINNLFFKCRHGHLTLLHPMKTLETHDLPHERAKLIHEEIQGICLIE
jgi:protein arginine kinase